MAAPKRTKGSERGAGICYARCSSKTRTAALINEQLDLSRWHADLARRTRTQIDDYLQPDAAELLAHCLETQVPWDLAWRSSEDAHVLPHKDLAALSAEQYRGLLEKSYAAASSEYQFAYECYQMITAYKEGRDPALPLHRIVEFLNSPQYLAFARALTGDPAIRRTSAQATRYARGHFLKFHSDFDAVEGRLYAYVINLTREWEADWGGLLQFIDAQGRVTETLMPRWNTLSMFKVPQGHCVSLVAPWARRPRHAITGWFMA